MVNDQPLMVDLKLLLVEATVFLKLILNWSPMKAYNTGLEALFENIRSWEKLCSIGLNLREIERSKRLQCKLDGYWNSNYSVTTLPLRHYVHHLPNNTGILLSHIKLLAILNWHCKAWLRLLSQFLIDCLRSFLTNRRDNSQIGEATWFARFPFP